MTRNGKIARLPRWVREQLNLRLADGGQGKRLVEWLNSLAEVQDVLDEEFRGRPINEQNLTEWKQGGYQEWLRHQDAREWVRTVSEEADEIAEEAGLVPLSDRLSSMVALMLGKMIRDVAAASSWENGKCRELLALARELAVLRSTDHRAAELRMELEDRERKETKRQEQAGKAARRKAEWEPFDNLQNAMAKETIVQHYTKGLDLDTKNQLRKVLKMPLRTTESQEQTTNQAQSNSIKPDQTS